MSRRGSRVRVPSAPQLSDDNLCLIFGSPDRPAVCSDFEASLDVCGDSNEEALWLITNLESQTSQ
ncbi:Fe-S-cluster oxidoreductase [Shewanella xiamenensis]|nr:Fe-S-cluster oxidoreductase [Shewanella xiamenensis]UML95659.1 Fe-S-cluster oxidoreductase [Shewanella xiamenensis]